MKTKTLLSLVAIIALLLFVVPMAVAQGPLGEDAIQPDVEEVEEPEEESVDTAAEEEPVAPVTGSLEESEVQPEDDAEVEAGTVGDEPAPALNQSLGEDALPEEEVGAASKIGAQDKLGGGSGWWTSISIQNPGSGTANFNMSAEVVDTGSGGPYNASDCSVDGGEAKIYNPGLAPNNNPRIGFSSDCGATGTDNLPTGFEGGVTLSADSPVVAVVSVGNNSVGSVGTSGGTASAFYQGVSAGSTSLNFPVAKADFFGSSTTFYVMAVEDATVTMSYSAQSGSAPADDGPHTIPAGQVHVFVPSSSDFYGSATATSSTGAIAGAVVEHQHSADPATFALSTRAFTPDDADTTIYAPIIKNDFYGGTTALVVQAVNDDIKVEIDFSVTNSMSGATCSAGTTSEYTISEGASATFGGPNDLKLPSGFGDGCFGAAVINVTDQGTSGNGAAVATVNEAKPDDGKKAVYSAFPASAASQTVAVPIVKEEFFNGRTAVVVQAVGASSTNTTITAQYVNSDNCASGCSITPDGGGAGSTPTSGGSAVNFRRFYNFSSQYSGSVPNSGTNNSVVISSNTLPVVAIAQESGFDDNADLDDKNYEGFAQ